VSTGRLVRADDVEVEDLCGRTVEALSFDASGTFFESVRLSGDVVLSFACNDSVILEITACDDKGDD
jgi:hypothetical protein